MAMDSLTTGLLEEGHQVKVLTLHTHKHPFLESELTSTYLETTEFEAVFAETELNLRDAFSHVITGESYHLSRFHVPEMERAIEDNLRERVFDVIILESLFTTSYIPAIRRLSDAELVLRAHNVEHQLWQEVSSGMSQDPRGGCSTCSKANCTTKKFESWVKSTPSWPSPRKMPSGSKKRWLTNARMQKAG